jgi:carbon starvation protein
VLLRSVRGRVDRAEPPRSAPLFTLDGHLAGDCDHGYGFAASVLPVWLLLAPRDYLSAFVKIGVVLALAWASSGAPPLQMPAVTQFIDGTGPVFAGKLFPVLLHHDRLRRHLGLPR